MKAPSYYFAQNVIVMQILITKQEKWPVCLGGPIFRLYFIL
ncbi:hypothetical protein E6C60_3388 [Paenibacillus algicola]|uniref:Uncharacterized protein n=1 Tax=Paenibacillus algicola TaxID=2565926 RepID=A0A4P8XTP0_9BACL|nr:hypothetical protein E6C60_3388 [Paenibacillus algicola]